MPKEKQKNTRIVKFINGSTDILIIAPHGRKLKPKDDTNTDILAIKIAENLKSSALINDSVNRNECNYNSISDATDTKKDSYFISDIRSVLDENGPTVVVWIHGIGKTGLRFYKEAKGFSGRLDCLIGFGQPDRHTILEASVDSLINLLLEQEIIVEKTRFDANDYRGWAKDNMNQRFRQQTEYNDLKKVQSVQLEFSQFRRRKDKLQHTADAISAVLSDLFRL